MKFEELLTSYRFSLHGLKAKKTRKLLSEDQFSECYYSLWSFFSRLKSYCEDFPKINFWDKKTIYADTNENGQVGTFDYRGVSFPVFIDDCGQQYYLEYEGHTFCSGSYNLMPEFEFADQLDECFDLNKFSEVSEDDL